VDVVFNARFEKMEFEVKTDAMGYKGVAGAVGKSYVMNSDDIYEFVITGGTIRKDVVVQNDLIPKNLQNRPKDHDSGNDKYPALSPAEIEAVESIDLGKTKGGVQKSPYYDEITLSAVEPESNTYFFYDLKFRIYGGVFGFDILDFVRKVTGKVISEGEGLSIGDVLPVGTKFTAKVTTSGQRPHIIMKTVGPSEGAAVFMSLSDDEKALIGALKPYVGKPIGEIRAYVESGSFSSILETGAAVAALESLEGTPYFEDGKLHL